MAVLVILGLIAFGAGAFVAWQRKDHPAMLIAIGLALTLWVIHPLA